MTASIAGELSYKKLCTLKMFSFLKRIQKTFICRINVSSRTNFTSLGSTFLHFVFLLLCIEFVNSQVLSSKDMYDLLNHKNYRDSEQTKKCEKAMNGTWFPEVPYTFGYCDTLNSDLTQLYEDSEKSFFDCWESQLTDSSKLDILRIMNRYRQNVANGKCLKFCQGKKRLVFELEWSKVREETARTVTIHYEILPRFQARDVFTGADYTLGGISYTIPEPALKGSIQVADFFIISFKMTTGLQRELRLHLGRMISNNRLFDWNVEQGIFNRALMIEVGCAFMVRRGVTTSNTTFNDEVVNGNVGYLTCQFRGLGYLNQSDIFTEATENTCTKAVIVNKFYHPAQVSDLYPELCKLKFQGTNLAEDIKNPRLLCQPNETTLERTCGGSKFQRSQITWTEKTFGYVVGIDQKTGLIAKANCHIPEKPPSLDGYPEYYEKYNCTLKQEVFVDANIRNCITWNCTDSQLTDMTRVEIRNKLNEARNQIANAKYPSFCKDCVKETFCDIMELQWHWYLEWKAAEKVKHCFQNEYMNVTVYDDHPFPKPAYFEENTLQFNHPRLLSQVDLPALIIDMFWKNRFHDWSNTAKTFRRGNAQWIGCAVVVKGKNKFTEYHLVCIYAALGNRSWTEKGTPDDQKCCPSCKEPLSSSKPCFSNTKKNIPPYKNLCTSIQREFTQNCEVRPYYDRCEDKSISLAWEQKFDRAGIRQRVDGTYETFEEMRPTPTTTATTTTTTATTTATTIQTSSTLSGETAPSTDITTSIVTIPIIETTLAELTPNPTIETTPAKLTPNPTIETTPAELTPDPDIIHPSELPRFDNSTHPDIDDDEYDVSVASKSGMRNYYAYGKKYCMVLIMFFLVLLSFLFFMLSLVFKYQVEKKVSKK